jgi:hypothetical protein
VVYDFNRLSLEKDNKKYELILNKSFYFWSQHPDVNVINSFYLKICEWCIDWFVYALFALNIL